MSSRTFCDNCGEQCTGKVYHVHVTASELTAQGTPVSHEQYMIIDLCRICGEAHAMGLVPDMASRLLPPPQPYYPPDLAYYSPEEVEGL